MIRIYSYPITPYYAYTMNSKFKPSKWHFAYFNFEINPDLYSEKSQFLFFVRLWTKSNNKPSFRIQLPRYVLWRLLAMTEVVRPSHTSTNNSKIFSRGFTKDWHYFEKLFKEKLEERKKQFTYRFTLHSLIGGLK